MCICVRVHSRFSLQSWGLCKSTLAFTWNFNVFHFKHWRRSRLVVFLKQMVEIGVVMNLDTGLNIAPSHADIWPSSDPNTQRSGLETQTAE